VSNITDIQAAIAKDKALVKANQTAIAKAKREIRWRTALNKRRQARLAKERHELEVAQHKSRSGASVAVGFALEMAKEGVHEIPAGSNSGPHITTWIRNGGGQPGWPWCQYFANRCLVSGGLQQFKDGYTPDFVNMARRGDHGFRVVPFAAIALGDLIYYKWPGVSNAICDHVGIYVGHNQDVEGNTSPGHSGSQNNGGGVYLRDLDGQRRPYIVAVVRPPYPPTINHK
jgi:hypothetical protein